MKKSGIIFALLVISVMAQAQTNDFRGFKVGQEVQIQGNCLAFGHAIITEINTNSLTVSEHQQCSVIPFSSIRSIEAVTSEVFKDSKYQLTAIQPQPIKPGILGWGEQEKIKEFRKDAGVFLARIDSAKVVVKSKTGEDGTATDKSQAARFIYALRDFCKRYDAGERFTIDQLNHYTPGEPQTMSGQTNLSK
jgi:hypothetical protein